VSGKSERRRRVRLDADGAPVVGRAGGVGRPVARQRRADARWFADGHGRSFDGCGGYDDGSRTDGCASG
jgi:hypothetical protein